MDIKNFIKNNTIDAIKNFLLINHNIFNKQLYCYDRQYKDNSYTIYTINNITNLDNFIIYLKDNIKDYTKILLINDIKYI